MTANAFITKQLDVDKDCCTYFGHCWSAWSTEMCMLEGQLQGLFVYHRKCATCGKEEWQ